MSPVGSISETRNPRREGFWRLADPKISITSLACMLVGGAVAAVDAGLDWTWLGVTGLALFCMEVAKNAWGDVIDFDSGNDLAVAPEDRTNFSGGKRVLVDGLLSRRETWGVAILFGGAGVALGAVIVFFREPAALWIGVTGLALGWSYHGSPLRLAYRGFGELDVFICYGPILVLSTYLIQTGELSWQAFWLSVPLGVLIMAFLWVNEFPDYAADRSAAKNNLVARLGRQRASRLLPLIYGCGFGVLLMLPFFGYPVWVLLGFAALPTTVFACVHTWRAPETFYRHQPVQPAALVSFVIYALGAAAGYLIPGL
jgi:1,4-dihydroxy-2-naphthoate octaprenyltransferase